MREEQQESHIVIVDMQMGFTQTFQTTGRPVITSEDDNDVDGINLYIKERNGAGRLDTVGVLASGTWNSIEVKKGTKE